MTYVEDKAEEFGAELFGTEDLRVDSEAIAEAYDPTPHPYLDDPVGWVEERLGGFLWSKQREVAESVRDHRYTAVKSCHDTGKSYSAAAISSWWLDVHPMGEAFVVTTAPTWKQVEAILWREMRKMHKKGQLPGRTTLDCRWYMGGSGRPGNEDEELVAYGRKPADYDQAAFQGIHARYVLVIIDEACGVPKLLYDAVDSLVTNANCRVLAIGNPDDPSSHFQKIHKPGSGWNRIDIAYDDTPNFTGEEVPEYLHELLISEEWVEERKTRWGVESPTYVAKVLAQFPDITDDTLLTPTMLLKAQATDLSHVRDIGRLGVDVARFGTDKTCIYWNRGGNIRLDYIMHKSDTTRTTGEVVKRTKKHKGRLPAVIDAIGVGAGVYDQAREQRQNVIEFVSSAKAFDPKRFVNRKAELYWTFRERCEQGEIDLPEDGVDDDLLAQLGSIKWFLDSKGRIGIESKDDMKKRGLPSPDRADACVYSTYEGASIPIPTTDELKEQEGSSVMSGVMEEKF